MECAWNSKISSKMHKKNCFAVSYADDDDHGDDDADEFG